MRAAILVLLAAACASAPRERPAVDPVPFLSFDTNAFPGAATALAGFAPADDGATLRVGDAALLGVEVHRGGEVGRQLLLLQAHALPTGTADGVNRGRVVGSFTITTTDEDGSKEKHEYWLRAVDVQLTRLTADGERLQQSVARLWEEPLCTGWWPNSYPGAPQRDHELGGVLSLTLQELANSDPNLKDLLFRVIDAPSLWSIATSLGVKVAMSWAIPTGGPVPIEVPWFHGEVRRAQMTLRINGDVASWVEMFVADPAGATMICGGMVGAIAWHPTEDGRFAVVRLLATRRGPAPGP